MKYILLPLLFILICIIIYNIIISVLSSFYDTANCSKWTNAVKWSPAVGSKQWTLQ